MQSVIEFLKKNILLSLLFVASWFLFVPGSPDIKLINQIVLLEILTLFLCQLAVYIHYKSPFTFSINTGKDGEVNSTEQHALIQSNSRIYQAVHLFVGMIVIGSYFINKGF